MSTIAENLIAINAQRLQLINILKSKNIPCDGTETFDELVQKVYAYQSEKDIILNDYSIAGCQLPTEDIEYMFNHYIVTSPLSTVTGKWDNCANLIHFPMSKYTYSGVTTLENMLTGNSKMESIDASGIDLSGVTADKTIGSSLSAYRSLDITNAKLSLLALKAFIRYSTLTNLIGAATCDLTDAKALGYVDLQNFFAGSAIPGESLQEILNKMVEQFSDQPFYLYYGFYNYKGAAEELILPAITVRNNTLYYCFAVVDKIKKVDISNLVFTGPVNMTSTFNSFAKNVTAAEREQYEIKLFDIKNTDVSTWSSCFQNCLLITSFDFNGFPIKAVSNFVANTFTGTGLTKIDLSNANIEDNPDLIDNGIGSWTSISSLEEFIAHTYIKSNKFLQGSEIRLHTVDLSNCTLAGMASLMRSSRYTSGSQVTYALKNISFENSTLDVLPDKILHRAGYLYPYLETVSFKNSTVTNMSYIAETSSSGFSFLENCTGLKNLDLTGMDFSTLYSGSKFLYGCKNLENVVFPADLRIATGSLNFSNATKLTKESLLSLLNSINEQSTQKTLYLGETNTAKLTAEEIAIATEKGWTVS